MPTQFPDGVYDRTHTFQNADDRAQYERTVSRDPIERAKIMQALITADPATPDAEIQLRLSAGPTVPVAPRPPVTVMQCFSRDVGHAGDFAPTNFSGKQSEYGGSSIPSLPAW